MKTYILSNLVILIITTGFLRAQTPTDPYYPHQFYLDQINVQDAWDITKGDPNVIETKTPDQLLYTLFIN